jgi:hypothetical protein
MSSSLKGINVKCSTSPIENLLKKQIYGKNMALIAVTKGLTQELVTTTAAVTSTMQIVEYHVKYSTTTDQTHLKQITVVVGVRVNLKKRLPL